MKKSFFVYILLLLAGSAHVHATIATTGGESEDRFIDDHVSENVSVERVTFSSACEPRDTLEDFEECYGRPCKGLCVVGGDERDDGQPLYRPLGTSPDSVCTEKDTKLVVRGSHEGKISLISFLRALKEDFTIMAYMWTESNKIRWCDSFPYLYSFGNFISGFK